MGMLSDGTMTSSVKKKKSKGDIMVSTLELLMKDIIELCEKEAREECRKYLNGMLELLVLSGRLSDICKLKEGIRKVAGEVYS